MTISAGGNDLIRPGGDPDALAARLASVSPEFARIWAQHDVAQVPEGRKGFLHPDVGELEFEHITFSHTEAEGHEFRVSFYTPRPGLSTTRALALFRSVTP